MSKDEFDLDRVSDKTLAAYGKSVAAKISLNSLGVSPSKEMQNVLDEARVPECPKSEGLLLGELVKAAESYKSVCGLTGSGGALDDLIGAALALAETLDKKSGQ
jgi:hypothetical protein